MLSKSRSFTLHTIVFAVPFLVWLSSCTGFPIKTPQVYPLPAEVAFAGEQVPLRYADAYSRIRNWYNFFLSKPWQVQEWLDRAQDIFPFVEERLQKREMPLDLKYIAVAESYLYPRAISSAGAAGIWQFTERTGMAFGLRVDDLVDERYDYVPATEATLDYFEQAKEATGSWILACASFNLGIRGVTDRV